MQFNPLTIVLTIIGGLIVAGLVGWIKRPRLVVLVPRMFSYSQLTDRGHLVEISIFNRGFKTEESIDVVLNHSLAYEVLGSNSQDVTVVGNKLHITRIGPSDEVTVLLLVENGMFKQDDIVQCLSKETKGKTVSKLEEVSPTGAQRIGLVAALIGLPLLLYAATFAIDYALSVQRETKKTGSAEASPVLEIQGWRVRRFYQTTSHALFKNFSDGKLTAAFSPISRKGDWVTIPVTLSNSTDKMLKIRVSMTTAASARKLKSYELSTGEIVLVPGKSEERTVRVIVPANATDPNEKMVFVEAFIQDSDADTLSMNTDFSVK
ncbi:MAG: hypothetical protein LBK67_10090 [Coriobacteriales bacterium]|jgi:hypothetical protein|nr:hypothetical protein [Coriobacteriales bacterium]